MVQQQRHRKNIEYVDTELLAAGMGRKAFKAAARAMGVGVGFMLLIPILPEIGEGEKAKAMIDIFYNISFVMIAYSITVGLGYFFMRANLNLILFILNWFLIPSVGIWFVMEGYGVISGGGS